MQAYVLTTRHGEPARNGARNRFTKKLLALETSLSLISQLCRESEPTLASVVVLDVILGASRDARHLERSSRSFC